MHHVLPRPDGKHWDGMFYWSPKLGKGSFFVFRPDSEQDRQTVLQRLNTLTPRERAVLEQVVAGKTSKETARALGSSHRTIDIHRGRIMEKMAVSTLADLVRARLFVGRSWTAAEPEST